MLSGRDLYKIWAPPDSIWSPWVAPAFFAQIACEESGICLAERVAPMEWFETKANPESAIVIDLAGVESFRLAMQLEEIGYCAVSLINASPSWLTLFGSNEAPLNVVLDMNPLVREVCANTIEMKNRVSPANAPPAFVLDARRRNGTRPLRDDMFDNRWMVFSQDFPSARFLLGRGIRRVILVQAGSWGPQEDLAHVLLRWQEADIAIELKQVASAGGPVGIRVSPPRRFRALCYRALELIGLHRSGAGGFGALVPGRSSGG